MYTDQFLNIPDGKLSADEKIKQNWTDSIDQTQTTDDNTK